MCLMSVKEEEAPIPARVTRVRRVVRRSPSPPPRREVRTTRQSIIEERKPSPPAPAPLPPPPPPQPSPPRTSTTIHTETRRTSRPPSSAAPSRTTHTNFVEVDHDSSSSSSSESDSRSRTTRKSSRSKAKSDAPAPSASEYSMHEREYRRERGFSSPRRPEYETYRYVEAPVRRSGSKGGYYDGPRASRDSYRRERMVVEDDYGRRRREYQR